MDIVRDRVADLNPDTPVLKARGRAGVSPDLVFGLDTRLFRTLQEVSLRPVAHVWSGAIV